jgi:tetratricopeptide (TPR) repeat protein
VRGRLALGIAFFYSYESDLARAEFSFAAKHEETAAAARYFLGRLANQEGNLQEALREIQKSLETTPDFAAAHAELGLLYLKQKEYEKAEHSLNRALALEPEDYQANLYLTMLYARTRDPRAEAQKRAFEELKKKRSEKVKEFYRIIEVRPLG